MKKLNLLLLAIAIACSVQAQTLVTPSPTPAQTAVNFTPQHTTFHYTVRLDQIQALTGTTASVPLFTTAKAAYPGDVTDPAAYTVIDSIIINPSTPVTGGSLSAVTAQVKTGNSYGSAQSVFTAVGYKTPYVLSTSGYVEAPNTVVNLELVSVGGNLSTATAGTIEVWILRRLLR